MRSAARLLAAAALLAPLAACGTAGWTLTLSNQTGADLTYCPVRTEPPPPRRVVSDRVLDDGTRVPIDLDDFNPVWWDPVSGLAVHVQHQFSASPREVLARVVLHEVPPGDEAGDPANHPVLVKEYPYEVDESLGRIVRVRVGPVGNQMPVSYVQE